MEIILFSWKEKWKKNIYRYIPLSDAVPITGNINIVIVLTVVLGNTSLRSGLLRSESCPNRNDGSCRQGPESGRTRQTRVEENCFYLHFSDKGKEAQEDKSLTSINQYTLVDFAVFGVTVFLSLLSIAKAIKKHCTRQSCTSKTISMSSLIFCITYTFL